MAKMQSRSRSPATSIYERFHLRTVIQASGTETAVGGALIHPEAVAAMVEASRAFVPIQQLNAAVGRKIAEATGAEAGYVTAGAAAGLLLSAAACITRGDPVRVRSLPDTEGMANEVIIHRVHRIKYDRMPRAAGGKLVEIGLPGQTEPWELETAVTEKTACVAYIVSPWTSPGALPFATVVEIAHRRDVPVIVDAASTLPPVEHLRRWIEEGADLVVYSGGKGICGPQDTGLLAGRADLIAAAVANGSPNQGSGRAAKVSKEAIVGLAVALDIFLTHDHQRDYREHLEQARMIVNSLANRPDVEATLIADPSRYPFPEILLAPTPSATWTAAELRGALIAGDPSIYCRVFLDQLEVRTDGLQLGDAELIAESIKAIFEHQRMSR